jgi:glucan phosphoethanolaminetransferase (alkaline phosphatase superfamily)
MDTQHDGPGALGETAPPGLREGRNESPLERLDRNWGEILQELRVTQTGIQILTGFLLTVPFQARFADLNDDQKLIYLVLVVLAAVTTALLVAPVSMHRLLFRRGAKSTLVTEADRFMRVGLVFLALVVSGVVLLVFDVVTTRTVALITSGALLAVLTGAWFALPAVLASRRPRAREGEGHDADATAKVAHGRGDQPG